MSVAELNSFVGQEQKEEHEIDTAIDNIIGTEEDIPIIANEPVTVSEDIPVLDDERIINAVLASDDLRYERKSDITDFPKPFVRAYLLVKLKYICFADNPWSSSLWHFSI